MRRTFQRVAACATWATVAFTLIAAAGGCASGSFYASNLPGRYQAPPFVASSQADLARFAVAKASSDVISSGDVLEITIVSGAEEQRPAPWVLRVDASGGLDLPHIGAVRVEGMPLTEAERLIREESIRRKIYKDPHVAIVMKEPRKVRVTVVGEVAEPGTYEIPASQASIVTAIAAAGGMSEKADTKIALRNPTYAANVRLTSAEEPIDASKEADPVSVGESSEAGEPAKVDDADAEPAAAESTKPEASEDEAKKDEPNLREMNVASKETTEEATAKAADADGEDAASESEGEIQLASAEEPVDGASATTAGYVESADGEIVIDLVAVASQGASFPVEDGAVVVVREKPSRTVQVLGLVNRPDRYEYPDDQELRLLDALALAGGRTMEIADSVKIIRQIPGEPRPIVILASVGYAKQGGEDNLALMPGDVVSVEETPLTFTVDTVRNLLRLGITTF